MYASHATHSSEKTQTKDGPSPSVIANGWTLIGSTNSFYSRVRRLRIRALGLNEEVCANSKTVPERLYVCSRKPALTFQDPIGHRTINSKDIGQVVTGQAVFP